MGAPHRSSLLLLILHSPSSSLLLLIPRSPSRARATPFPNPLRWATWIWRVLKGVDGGKVWGCFIVFLSRVIFTSWWRAWERWYRFPLKWCNACWHAPFIDFDVLCWIFKVNPLNYEIIILLILIWLINSKGGEKILKFNFYNNNKGFKKIIII